MGERLIEQQAANFKDVRRSDGELFSVDFTRYRIDLDLPADDPCLVSAQDFHRDEMQVLLGLQVAALHPPGAEISKSMWDSTMLAMESGTVVSKAAAWWYYMGEIPLTRVVGAAVKNSAGGYHEGTLQQFAEAIGGLGR